MVTGLFYLAYVLGLKTCQNFATLNELEYQYKFFAGGCFINTDRGWFQLDQVVNVILGK
jgi:hypothetical protein